MDPVVILTVMVVAAIVIALVQFATGRGRPRKGPDRRWGPGGFGGADSVWPFDGSSGGGGGGDAGGGGGDAGGGGGGGDAGGGGN